jgi:competence protein ComEA
MGMALGSRQKLAFSSLGVIGVAFATVVGLTYSRQNNLVPTHRPGALVVQVAGAVKDPGVFEMPKGSRISDAIKRAGGFSRDADAARVNQAQALSDGTKLQIPRVGDPEESIQTLIPQLESGEKRLTGGSPSSGSGKKQLPPYASISINNASIEQLMQLPRVGKATAQRIVEFRMQLGGFRAIEDLDRVKGIGPKTLELIRPYVTL